MTALIETQLIQLAYFVAQINTQVCTKGGGGGGEDGRPCWHSQEVRQLYTASRLLRLYGHNMVS